MGYGSGTSRQRHDHARHPSGDAAIGGSAQRLSGAVPIEPEDGGQVAQAGLRARCADGPQGGSFHRSDGRGGSCNRRLPQAHPAAARRLPLCLAGDHSAPDPLVTAQMPATAWHQPVAGGGRRQAQEGLQALPHRLLPHRYRRGQDRGGQALFVRGHRPDHQVRLRPNCTRLPTSGPPPASCKP